MNSKLKKFALEQRTHTCSRLADEKCGKGGPMDCQCGSSIQPNTSILNALDAFGRQRLSKHYFMRDFLYSEITACQFRMTGHQVRQGPAGTFWSRFDT